MNNKPLVAIDGRLLRARRGMGNVLYRLLNEMAAMPSDFKFLVYVDTPEAAAAVPVAQHITVCNLGRGLYPIWEQWTLARAVSRDKPAILHCPANTGPWCAWADTRVVLTIHDLLFMLPLPQSPSLYQRLGRAYYTACARRLAPKVSQVITVSKHSANDICRLLGLGEDRVEVNYPASSFSEYEIRQARECSLPFELPTRYHLSLGSIDPRKNSFRILEAFAHASVRTKAPVALVFAGCEDAVIQILAKRARALGIDARTRFFGFLPAVSLIALFLRAEALLYPSLYEGFGLPVLDAMMCNCPVLTSDMSSMPEIAGGAAFLVRPTDLNSITDGISQFMNEPELLASLRKRGAHRAGAFSWHKMAENTLRIYENVLVNKP